MPRKKTYGFRDSQVADQLKQLVGGGDSPLSEIGHFAPSYILKAPAGGITKRSGSTVNYANCTVQSITGITGTTTGSGTLGTESIDLPVFNLSANDDVAANAYVIALYAGGVLVCNWEDC